MREEIAGLWGGFKRIMFTLWALQITLSPRFEEDCEEALIFDRRRRVLNPISLCSAHFKAANTEFPISEMFAMHRADKEILFMEYSCTHGEKKVETTLNWRWMPLMENACF